MTFSYSLELGFPTEPVAGWVLQDGEVDGLELSEECSNVWGGGSMVG